MGGKAIPTSTPIVHEDAEKLKSLLEGILEKMGIPKDKYAFVGSFGKKNPGDTYGDVDIVIDWKALIHKPIPIAHDYHSGTEHLDEAYDEFLERLIQYQQNHAPPFIGKVKQMKSIGIISVAFPMRSMISFDMFPTQIAQIDFIIVEDIKWAEWAYYSPAPSESSYKGLFRNEIMYAVAKYCNHLPVKKWEDKTPQVWFRYFFDLRRGLLRGKQHNIGKKGKPIKTVTTVDKWVFTTNPAKAVVTMFGINYIPEQLLTFEETWRALQNKFGPGPKIWELEEMIEKGIKSKGHNYPDFIIEKYHGQ